MTLRISSKLELPTDSLKKKKKNQQRSMLRQKEHIFRCSMIKTVNVSCTI